MRGGKVILVAAMALLFVVGCELFGGNEGNGDETPTPMTITVEIRPLGGAE